jgi:lactoylglutathione lyase
MDMDTSIDFYTRTLNLKVIHRNVASDGSFVIVMMGNDAQDFQLELTWLRDHTEPYDLSDNETHLGLVAADYDAAHEKHKEMGVICFENYDMGIYFIADPDGYWTEICPDNSKNR